MKNIIEFLLFLNLSFYGINGTHVLDLGAAHLLAHSLAHPAGTSVSSVKCDKPVHSASHYGQHGHFFWHVVRQILLKIHEYRSHL